MVTVELEHRSARWFKFRASLRSPSAGTRALGPGEWKRDPSRSLHVLNGTWWPKWLAAWLRVLQRVISKPRGYYIRLFLFCSIIHIKTLLKHIMKLLYHYFFYSFWTIISYYIKCLPVNPAIISLISKLLYQFFLVSIMTIISIKTLSWHLFLITSIMSLISFYLYYINYFFLYILCQL